MCNKSNIYQNIIIMSKLKGYVKRRMKGHVSALVTHV